MLKRMAALAMALALPACGGGGGGGSPAAPSTPAPTPTPVSYNGTYSGTMTITGAGVAALPVTGTTTITHTGNALAFGPLTISGVVSGSFGSGSAVLNGNTFVGTGAYNSAGCGVSTSAWTGHFSGDGRPMNLKVIVTPELASCSEFQFLGELSR